MKIKALAKNGTTGVVEWYKSIYTDGNKVYFNTPTRGIQRLKDPQQIWVTLGSEREYQCVYDLKVINSSKTESNKESVELVKFYDVQMVLSNPNKFYIFGDNLAGWGRGGQATIRECPTSLLKLDPLCTLGHFLMILTMRKK